MTTPDLINAGFEGLGGLMMWTNVRALYRDKQLKGVNIWATVMFNAWGVWNLWYYPHLGQWVSFGGGLVIVSANSVWVWLAFRYRWAAKQQLYGLCPVCFNKKTIIHRRAWGTHEPCPRCLPHAHAAWTAQYYEKLYGRPSADVMAELEKERGLGL